MTIKIVYDRGDRETVITYPNANANADVTDEQIKSYATIVHPDWVFVVIDHNDIFNRRFIMRDR